MHLFPPILRWAAVVLCGMTLFLGMHPVSAQPTDPNQAASASQTLAVSPDGLVSQSSAGQRADSAGASGGSISADGSRVAFESASDTLDRSADGNGFTDVFVRDRGDGITINASHALNGADANGSSFDARLSGNGRYVAFTSVASDLIRSDTNEAADGFVHDLETGVTRLASIDARGRQLESPTRIVDVSDDGRKVLLAIEADAPDLVSFRVIDWVAETVISVGDGVGSVAGNQTPSASLSGDGQMVAFLTPEPLSDDDEDNDVDVYLADLSDSSADQVRILSGDAEVGPDVLLASDGTAFFTENTEDAGWGLIRVDVDSGVTQLVSIDEDGTPMTGLDSDLVFGSNRSATSVVWATDVPTGDDRNQTSDVFQRDLDANVTYRVSVERHGFELVGASVLTTTMRSISDDSLVVAFTSMSAELVPDDVNQAADVFVATPASTCDDQFITVFLAAGERPTERDDVILGSRRSETIDAAGGNDLVCAGDGNDLVLGGDGNDRIFGEAGNDIIEGGEQKDVLDGGVGNDKLYGDEDRDTLIGGDGADLLEGGSGRDRLLGGAGADRLLGEKGADLLDGGSGDDELLGGASRDKIIGRKGNDVLRGGGGNDILKAGSGSDDLDGGVGTDRIDGGPGSDACRLDEDGRSERRVNCES